MFYCPKKYFQKQFRCLGLSLSILFVLTSRTMAADMASIEGVVQVVDREGNNKKDNSGVIVFLDEIENYSAASVSDKTETIRQVNKRFVPGVLPVMVGTTVNFPNDDTVFHNVFSLSKTNPFDLGLYRQGTSKYKKFTNTGLVKVYCNIHPQMVSYVLVLNNPFFTITDRDGRFVFRDVPLGPLTIRSWYPKTRSHPEQRLNITKDGLKNINLTFIEDLRLRIQEETIEIKHKNKWGQDYPAKY